MGSRPISLQYAAQTLWLFQDNWTFDTNELHRPNKDWHVSLAAKPTINTTSVASCYVPNLILSSEKGQVQGLQNHGCPLL